MYANAFYTAAFQANSYSLNFGGVPFDPAKDELAEVMPRLRQVADDSTEIG